MVYLYEIVCSSETEKEWRDSYWLDKEQARHEFNSLVDAVNLGDTECQDINEVVLFRRALGVAGNGDPYWNNKRDKLIVAAERKSDSEFLTISHEEDE